MTSDTHTTPQPEPPPPPRGQVRAYLIERANSPAVSDPRRISIRHALDVLDQERWWERHTITGDLTCPQPTSTPA